MAAARIMLVALLAMFAVQVRCTTNLRAPNMDYLVQRTLQATETLLSSYTHQVEALGERTQGDVGDLQALLQREQSKEDTFGERLVSEIKSDVQFAEQQLEDVAREHGVDIQDCLATERAATATLLPQVVANISLCSAPLLAVSVQLQEATMIPMRLAAMLDATTNRTLMRCVEGHEPEPAIQCLGATTKGFVTQLAVAINSLASIVGSITRVANMSEGMMRECVNNWLNGAIRQEDAIMLILETCITDKLNVTSVPKTYHSPS